MRCEDIQPLGSFNPSSSRRLFFGGSSCLGLEGFQPLWGKTWRLPVNNPLRAQLPRAGVNWLRAQLSSEGVNLLLCGSGTLLGAGWLRAQLPREGVKWHLCVSTPLLGLRHHEVWYHRVLTPSHTPSPASPNTDRRKPATLGVRSVPPYIVRDY